jgi:hypothetical protein
VFEQSFGDRLEAARPIARIVALAQERVSQLPQPSFAFAGSL